MESRKEKIKRLNGEIIHNAVIMACENTNRLVIINYSHIGKYADMDAKSVKKLILVKSKELMDDENTLRFFRTETTANKYLLFVSIYDGKSTLDYYAKELSISKRTVVDFKNYMKQNIEYFNEELYNQLN